MTEYAAGVRLPEFIEGSVFAPLAWGRRKRREALCPAVATARDELRDRLSQLGWDQVEDSELCVEYFSGSDFDTIEFMIVHMPQIPLEAFGGRCDGELIGNPTTTPPSELTLIHDFDLTDGDDVIEDPLPTRQRFRFTGGMTRDGRRWRYDLSDESLSVPNDDD